MSRLEALKQMLAEDPSDPFLNYALALEYERSGEIQKAIGQAEKIMKQDPSYLPVYYMVATWQYKAGDLAAAKSHLLNGKALALKQNDHKTANEIQSFLDEIAE